MHRSAELTISSEWALFIDIVSGDSLLRGLEAQADGAVVARGAAFGDDALGAEEDTVLLLERLFCLCEELRRHVGVVVVVAAVVVGSGGGGGGG